MLLALLFLLCAQVELGRAIGFSYTRYNGSIRIQTSPTSYAFSEPRHLGPVNVSAVSANNGYLYVYHADDCALGVYTSWNLFQGQQSFLGVIEQASRYTLGRDLGPHWVDHLEAYRFDDGRLVSATGTGEENFELFQAGDYTVHMLDERTFSATKPNMAGNVAHVFVDGDKVTHVSTDGEVHMRPIVCMRADQADLLAEIRSTIGPVALARKLIARLNQRLESKAQELATKLEQRLLAFDDEFLRESSRLEEQLDSLLLGGGESPATEQATPEQ